MMPKKVDGVIETVRYDPKGMISQVRVYEKRGPTFSDRVLLSRDQLIQKLRIGKKFYVGKRILLQASTFELGTAVSLAGQAGQEFIVSNPGQHDHDDIQGVPLF
ncbi:MAG TPA: hypothetical protein VF338_03060 [Leptolinea sp.]